MTKIVFHPLAEQELVDAASYYEEQNQGFGLEYQPFQGTFLSFLDFDSLSNRAVET